MYENYTRISQIQKAAENVGDKTLSHGAMHGFNSRLSETIYGGRFFVMSSQFRGTTTTGTRYYEVFECRNGHITKVSKQLTRHLAHKCAKETADLATRQALVKK